MFTDSTIFLVFYFLSVCAEPNPGNGFDHEKYSWTQSLGDVSLHIPMPEGTRGKSIACEIKSKTLQAGLKGQEPILKVHYFPQTLCMRPSETISNLYFSLSISLTRWHRALLKIRLVT